jgi:hypothetical protein
VGSFQVGGALYPYLQISGSEMADVTHIARESIFQQYRGRMKSPSGVLAFVCGEAPGSMNPTVVSR